MPAVALSEAHFQISLLLSTAGSCESSQIQVETSTKRARRRTEEQNRILMVGHNVEGQTGCSEVPRGVN